MSVTIFATAALVVGFSYLPNASSGSSQPYVPSEFLEARIRAGIAADKITNLTSMSRANLDGIRDADISGDYTVGLALVADETDRNDEIQDTAADMSEDLRDMARYLEEVQPIEATEVGVSAIAIGIELVQRLIIYNNNTEELLGVLGTRFRSGSSEETRTKIENLISAMNDDANVINSLSNNYRSAMLQFDGLTQ